MAALINDIQSKDSKPAFVLKIDGFGSDVNDAVFIPGEDAVVTGTEDRTVRVWIRRESGKFWPCAMEILPSPTHCLLYNPDKRRLYAGVDNGTVIELELSTDLNSITHKRDYLSHVGRVTGLAVANDFKWIVSTSKDKTVTWFSTENGRHVDAYQLESPGTCMTYDPTSHYAFVGDAAGCITLLSLGMKSGQSECRVVRVLRGHSKSITCLTWDSVKSCLFSSSTDCSIIMWDIGGAKGAAFELQAHSKEVGSVCWWSEGNSNPRPGDSPGLVISGGLDNLLVFWIMSPSRIETPRWSDVDNCELCASPFFWNVRRMWSIKSIGSRQHHCRKCGKAICAKCSVSRSNLPVMGFEKEVRLCQTCYPTITETDKRSMVISTDSRHPIHRMKLLESAKLLMTIGKDRVIKIWDIQALV